MLIRDENRLKSTRETAHVVWAEAECVISSDTGVRQNDDTSVPGDGSLGRVGDVGVHRWRGGEGCARIRANCWCPKERNRQTHLTT